MNLLILKNYFFIALNFLFFIMLSIIPIPENLLWLKPDFLILSVIYWVLAAPSLVGVYFAFITGLFVDLLYNTPFGLCGLTLALVAYLTNLLRIKLRSLCLWQQALTILVLTGFYKLVLLWGSLFSVTITVAPYYWLSIFINIVFWPMVYVSLRYYQQLFYLY